MKPINPVILEAYKTYLPLLEKLAATEFKDLSPTEKMIRNWHFMIVSHEEALEILVQAGSKYNPQLTIMQYITETKAFMVTLMEEYLKGA